MLSGLKCQRTCFCMIDKTPIVIALFTQFLKPVNSHIPVMNITIVLKRFLPFCSLFSCFCSYSQEKRDNMIDEDAIKQTSTVGDVGIKNSIMSVRSNTVSVQKLLKKFPDKQYLTFPETRENAIRLLDGIPTTWLKREEKSMTGFSATAQPGEYFVFQVGVYASGNALHHLSVLFPHLVSSNAVTITETTCFNTEGVDYDGKAMKKAPDVDKGRVQPLWFGVQIPPTATGIYDGTVTIKPEGLPATKIAISIMVAGERVENKGYNIPAKMARLNWLNSTIDTDDEITKGFEPLNRKGNLISIIGRKIEVGTNGFPSGITTYFDNNNLALKQSGEAILARPLSFIIEQLNDKAVPFTQGPITYKDHFPGSTEWKVELKNPAVSILITAHAEYDGFIQYKLAVTPLKTLAIKDIRLEVPMQKEKSKYMMGLDREGGFRPAKWDWKWDVINKNQDEVWMGGVNGGLKIKLKGANYKRQLINIYYSFGPLHEPESWGNGLKGGIKIGESNGATLLNAYSGARTLVKGKTYDYDFDLLVTPFKLINRDVQYGDRYYHSDIDTSSHFVQTALDHGANIINIHHKKDIYPFIDYPYHEDNIGDLKNFITDAHKHDLKVKLYYTTRELTVNAPEIWAMRSLNNEIIYPGPGNDTRTIINPDGPHPWLAENFREKFIPGWKCTFVKGKYAGRQDIAVLTTPDSRLNNYYLEGLNWLCDNIQIDGIYIDDLALDRETMKRARKILDRKRPGAKIDMHTWNHYNKFGKYASSLNLYTDLLPFIDQLWIGEARNYNLAPDYWLVEISGVPFGLTSQMLRDGGNIWRGMVFGITGRLGWYKSKTPEYIWKFWDQHEFTHKEQIGFWDDSSPVKCSSDSVQATVYKGKDEAVIAVANWTDNTQLCRLQINWEKLGFNPAAVEISIPAIEEFQDQQQHLDLNKELSIEAAKGYMILIKNKQ